MTNPIVNVAVNIQTAPAPSTLQKTGAFISAGGTNTSPGTKSLLTQFSDLAPLLNAPATLSGISWSGEVATATAAAAHGLPIGQVINLTIAGASPILSESVVGVAKEAVNGTFVEPTKFIPCVPKVSTNLKVSRPEQVIGYRGQRADVATGLETDVTLTGELIPDGSWALLAAAAFGSGGDSYSSKEGVAKHLLTPQPQLPSMSIEIATDIISGERLLDRRIVGCLVDRFQLKATNQQFSQVESALIGIKEETPATPGQPSAAALLPTFSAAAYQPLDFSLVAATYKGGSRTDLKDCTIGLNNKVVRVFSSNGKLTVARLVPTRREVTVQTNLDFIDLTFYTDWVATAKTSGIVLTHTSKLNVGGSGKPYVVQFTLPGLRPMGVWDNPAQSDVLEQNLSWSATVEGNNEIEALFENGDVGAYA